MATPAAPESGDTMRSTDITNLMKGINDLEANAIDWYFESFYVPADGLLYNVMCVYSDGEIIDEVRVGNFEKYYLVKAKPETGRVVYVKPIDFSGLRVWQGTSTQIDGKYPLIPVFDTDQTNIYVTCRFQNGPPTAPPYTVEILKLDMDGNYISTVSAPVPAALWGMAYREAEENSYITNGYHYYGAMPVTYYKSLPIPVLSQCFYLDNDLGKFFVQVSESKAVWSFAKDGSSYSMYDEVTEFFEQGYCCAFSRCADGTIIKADGVAEYYPEIVNGVEVYKTRYYYYVANMSHNPIAYDNRIGSYYTSHAADRMWGLLVESNDDLDNLPWLDGGGFGTFWLREHAHTDPAILDFYPSKRHTNWTIGVYDRTTKTKKYTLNVTQFTSIAESGGNIPDSYDYVMASIVAGSSHMAGKGNYIVSPTSTVYAGRDFPLSYGVTEVPGSAMDTDEYRACDYVIVAHISVNFFNDMGGWPSITDTHLFRAFFDADTGELLGYVELLRTNSITQWNAYRWNEAGIPLGSPPIADEALTFANATWPPYTTVAHRSGCHPVISHIVDIREAIEDVCTKYADESYELFMLESILETVHPGTNTWLRTTQEMIDLDFCDVTDIQELYDVVHLLEESLPL